MILILLFICVLCYASIGLPNRRHSQGRGDLEDEEDEKEKVETPVTVLGNKGVGRGE